MCEKRLHHPPAERPKTSAALGLFENVSCRFRTVINHARGEMKRLFSVVGAIVLAGCSAAPSLPTQVQSQDVMTRASGGSFSAHYAGTDGFVQCGDPTQGRGTFNFSGAGSGTFIHGSTETGTMSADPPMCYWSGTATLTNSLHPRNTIAVQLSFTSGNGNFGDPCHPRAYKKVQFTISGGTGKFVNATGKGTIVFTCNNGNYSDRWSGTIAF